MLQIQFTSEDPQLALDAANLAAELYIADQLEAKFNAVRRANDWLMARFGQLRQELQQTRRGSPSYAPAPASRAA